MQYVLYSLTFRQPIVNISPEKTVWGLQGVVNGLFYL